MIDLDKDNFDVEVLQADEVVFVDFWNDKCEPCKALMPEVYEFAKKNEGRAKFCKLDTTGNRRLAISQKVMGVPAFLFYKNGEKVFSFDHGAIEQGGMPAVQEKLEELLCT